MNISFTHNIQSPQFRTARSSVATAIQQSLETIKILKKLSEILDVHVRKQSEELNERRISNEGPIVTLSGYELAAIIGALRDYITLRIANIVDSNPATKSLKDFPAVNLNKIKAIPQITEILLARDNWIGHINKRFIGPVNHEILYSPEIVGLLQHLEMLVCTNMLTERS